MQTKQIALTPPESYKLMTPGHKEARSTWLTNVLMRTSLCTVAVLYGAFWLWQRRNARQLWNVIWRRDQ